LDPAKEPFLSVAGIADDPLASVTWNTQASGMKISPDAASAEQVAKLVADFDDQRLPVWQKAAQALEALHDTAEQTIRKTLAANPALEVRQRLEQILEKGNKEVIRKLRAIEALEHIGTPEARQVLQTLAERAPNPRLTEAAAAALQRLTQRPGP
jgi:hypothetical protein